MTGDALYLRHIVDAIERITAYTAGGKDAFMKNTMVQDATIRNLEIIGEAAKQITPEYRGAHPDIPWPQMAGMRDVLVHRYMAVDLDIVWDVLTNRLGGLEARLRNLLHGEGD
ncbi:MAG: DUF86 domain-containing protein [Proteobacteria bacterium]|nr:DUF86 domain-containing protein [Pseudomonadota bacterium]